MYVDCIPEYTAFFDAKNAVQEKKKGKTEVKLCTVVSTETDSLSTETDSEKSLVISLWIDIFIYRLLFIMLLFNVDSAKKNQIVQTLLSLKKTILKYFMKSSYIFCSIVCALKRV